MLEINIKSATDNKGAFQNLDEGQVLDTLIYLNRQIFLLFLLFCSIQADY